MSATDEDKAEVLRLRAAGLGYQEIERRMGWPDTHGNRPWRIVNGAGGAGHPTRGATISLWKAVAGGRSFKAIEKMLASHGIGCSKGDVSQWEDRYEIYVAEADRERAEELLFKPADEWQVQSLDSLSDPTK